MVLENGPLGNYIMHEGMSCHLLHVLIFLGIYNKNRLDDMKKYMDFGIFLPANRPTVSAPHRF